MFICCFVLILYLIHSYSAVFDKYLFLMVKYVIVLCEYIFIFI